MNASRQFSININNNVAENTQAAESLIRDTDTGKILVAYPNYNILQKAKLCMLAQASKQPGMVFQLLQ